MFSYLVFVLNTSWRLATLTMIHSSVTSREDYCNFLYILLPLKVVFKLDANCSNLDLGWCWVQFEMLCNLGRSKLKSSSHRDPIQLCPTTVEGCIPPGASFCLSASYGFLGGSTLTAWNGMSSLVCFSSCLSTDSENNGFHKASIFCKFCCLWYADIFSKKA